VNFENIADPDLMALVADGQDGALETIVRRHQRPLVNFFCRLGADGDGAQDCAQETFLRLFRYRDRYRPSAPFGSFLYTLARHAWADWRRRIERRKAVRLEGEEEPGEEDGTRDERLDLEAALRSLPEHLRWVVTLSVYQGLAYAEIAEVLEIPLGTVKSRMFHAVRRLREALHAEIDG
jgi:RNA polymerase sigma-70 factor (ECF subfamily)